MSCVQYLDRLPKIEIDHAQIDDVIKNGINLHHVPNNIYYAIFNVHDDLKNLGVKLFGKPYNVRLHIMYPPRLPIHKDTNRKVAYNYIIDPGGEEVFTCFYDDDQKLIEKVCIEANRWHKLNVQMFHNVENMTRPRIALTVYPPEKTNFPSPVVDINYNIDTEILFKEYKRLLDMPQPDYKFTKDGVEKKNTLNGLKVLGTQDYSKDRDSLLIKEAKKFADYFNIKDDFIALFMWMAPNFELSWHIDDASVCRSSVNFILTDNSAPINFREGEFQYKTAAIDIMQEHAVFNNSDERLIFRISFKNLTHEELVNEYIHSKNPI